MLKVSNAGERPTHGSFLPHRVRISEARYYSTCTMERVNHNWTECTLARCLPSSNAPPHQPVQATRDRPQTPGLTSKDCIVVSGLLSPVLVLVLSPKYTLCTVYLHPTWNRHGEVDHLSHLLLQHHHAALDGVLNTKLFIGPWNCTDLPWSFPLELYRPCCPISKTRVGV